MEKGKFIVLIENVEHSMLSLWSVHKPGRKTPTHKVDKQMCMTIDVHTNNFKKFS